jgi:CRP-like cAMP-binding protein
MLKYCINRLSAYTALSSVEISALHDAIEKEVHYEKGDDVARVGSAPKCLNIIYDGWASRYKLLENGDEHIMAYLLPGDMCDIHITLLKRMDHSIRAETSLTVGVINEMNIDRIMNQYPRLARAMFWSMMVDESITREWLVNLAGRGAEERVAHLLCELLVRSRVVGLTEDNSFYFPLNQKKIGETMGLTSVHTNRVLQNLRREELITFKQKYVQILDWERLKGFSGFHEEYLHMNSG